MKVDLGGGMWAERDDGPPGVFHRAVAADLGQFPGSSSARVLALECGHIVIVFGPRDRLPERGNRLYCEQCKCSAN